MTRTFYSWHGDLAPWRLVVASLLTHGMVMGGGRTPHGFFFPPFLLAPALGTSTALLLPRHAVLAAVLLPLDTLHESC